MFVEADALDRTSAFYQALLGGRESMRFDYSEAGLKLAAVSSATLSLLIIAGPAERRGPFDATRLTSRVANLESAIDVLGRSGAVQLESIQPTPAGRKTRFRHSDGLVVEYVDHAARS